MLVLLATVVPQSTLWTKCHLMNVTPKSCVSSYSEATLNLYLDLEKKIGIHLVHTFWRTFYKFSQPHSRVCQCLGHVLPDCSRRTQLKNASWFHLFKNGGKYVCVYFVYFLPGTNRPKGVKGTQAGLNLRRLLSGTAFPMESSIYLKPDPFLFPPLSLYWVPNHCSVSLLKVEHTVAGAKSCGCVCLRLRLLSDLRQLAEEILFQNSEPWEKRLPAVLPSHLRDKSGHLKS